MKYLPSIVKANYVANFMIDLTFDDGTSAVVDFSSWIHGEVFEPLRKKSFFKRFFLDGSTVAWPNGADIAPETLYLAAKTANRHHSENTATKRRRSA